MWTAGRYTYSESEMKGRGFLHFFDGLRLFYDMRGLYIVRVCVWYIPNEDKGHLSLSSLFDVGSSGSPFRAELGLLFSKNFSPSFCFRRISFEKNVSVTSCSKTIRK